VSDALDSESEWVFPLSSKTSDDDDAALARDDSPRQREGLPRAYRMRADRHYVDQLDVPSFGNPVRMVPVSDVDAAQLPAHIDLRALIESIRKSGIVRPLLVRRRGSRYAVVAGRKRLAAAHVLRMSTVPTVMYDLDESQAAVLAAADNLVVGTPEAAADRSHLTAGVRQAIARHLATVRACADLAADSGRWTTRPARDLVLAHSWRAAQLLDTLDLLANTSVPHGLNPSVGHIVNCVIDGFSAEARLGGITINTEVLDGRLPAGVAGHELHACLSAAMLAMLPLVENAAAPILVIKADASGTGSAVFEIGQSAVAVSAGMARDFFDEDAAGIRPGGWPAVAGALACRAFARRHAGDAVMAVGTNGSSQVRISLPQRSPGPTPREHM
jgi:hypothetical protein